MPPGVQISQQDAWALVAYADRINKGQYVKFPEFDQDTGKISVQPNRDIIKEQLRCEMANVTDADRALGVKMYEHFQGLAFTALGGGGQPLREYDQKIINLISKDTMPAGISMVYLAPMGARYWREIKREEQTEIQEKIGATSTHQGSVGGPYAGKVVVLSKFMGKLFPGSVVKATDGTNLYFWTSSKTVDVWPDSPEPFTISASVKAHGSTREGHPETRLTRVKIT